MTWLESRGINVGGGVISVVAAECFPVPYPPAKVFQSAALFHGFCAAIEDCNGQWVSALKRGEYLPVHMLCKFSTLRVSIWCILPASTVRTGAASRGGMAASL